MANTNGKMLAIPRHTGACCKDHQHGYLGDKRETRRAVRRRDRQQALRDERRADG